MTLSTVTFAALLGWGVGCILIRLPDPLRRLAHTQPDARHPELISIARWAVPAISALYFALSRDVMSWAIYAVLMAITLVDIKYHLIPDAITLPAIALLVLRVFIQDETALPFWLGGGMALAIFMATYVLRPGGLGGGDVKLAVAIGLLLGFPSMLWALLIGAVSGGITLIALTRQNHKLMIPYGPFLCLGTLIVFQMG